VRKFARELGVDVARVPGTGPKGRITKDVTGFVKGVMSGQRAAPGAAAAPAGGGELNLLPWPKVDFASSARSRRSRCRASRRSRARTCIATG
jgi:pyruvate dehydrogenase E2 component (dihydrolipoamide acetyltransferase)